MPEKIRWGILSTATINDVIIEGIHNSPRSELIGVASRGPERAKKYASERNIPKAYGSYEAILDDREIDVVYISVPNALHCEWTVKAAEAGKHILCEKPIVTSTKDFDKIEPAAKKNNIVLFEAFMYLHHPQTSKVKELLNSGRLGDIKFINSWFDYYLPKDDVNNIRLKKEMHGGSLWDVGVYPNSLSITMAMSGAPVEVYAVKKIEDTDVDLSAYGHLRFSNNIIAQFSVSMRTPFRVGAHIVGEDGYIAIEKPWKPGLDRKETQIVFTTKENKTEVFRFPGVSPYQSEVEAMEACIIDSSDPLVPLSLSREFLKSMLALRESARKGKLVKL